MGPPLLFLFAQLRHASAILPEGKTALSGSSDNTLKLWALPGPTP